MFVSTAIIALAASGLVSAAPARWTKRASADVLVFQFADVLEQLESKFYKAAIDKYQDSDFQAAGYSSTLVAQQQLVQIQSDEAIHESVIRDTLAAVGAKPVDSCKFDFSSVLTDVSTTMAAARLVENVGVGAYLGGAALISDPQLLNAAATILTVEARHQTMLNILSGSGTAIPLAFDLPLTPPEVLAIAGPFISGCDLGITANPGLTVTNKAVTTGTQLSFSSKAISGSMDGMFCQMLQGGMPESISLPANQCVVPAGINGPVAIYVTKDSQPLLSNVIKRSNLTVVAGPTMAFIDIQPEAMGQLIRPSAGGNSSSSTNMISPDAAASITASASGSSSTGSSGSSNSSSSSPSSSGGSSSSSPNPANDAAAGGPNKFTGSADGGAIDVKGWKNLPKGQ